jgi:hypothetical protein
LEIPNCDVTPFGRQALQPGLSAGIKRGFMREFRLSAKGRGQIDRADAGREAIKIRNCSSPFGGGFSV